MKTKLFVLSLVAVFAFALSLPLGSAAQQRERKHSTETITRVNPPDNNSDSDLPEKDEFHQSYQLAAGAKVEVQGINGSVEIETAPGSTAQVNVYRSARTREDLEFRKVLVEPEVRSSLAPQFVELITSSIDYA